MKDYLYIPDFASKAGVTPQAVYKRIKKPNNPIHSFIKEEPEGLTIHKSALEVLYGIKEEETTIQPGSKVDKPLLNKPKENQEEKHQETASNKVIEILREQLQAQREEIQEKNKQIADLNERLADSQRMIDQQQRLSMADKQQILLLQANQKKGLLTRFKGLFSKNDQEENN